MHALMSCKNSVSIAYSPTRKVVVNYLNCLHRAYNGRKKIINQHSQTFDPCIMYAIKKMYVIYVLTHCTHYLLFVLKIFLSQYKPLLLIHCSLQFKVAGGVLYNIFANIGLLELKPNHVLHLGIYLKEWHQGEGRG